MFIKDKSFFDYFCGQANKQFLSLLGLILFLVSSLTAQDIDSSFTLSYSIPVKAKSFTTDKLRQVYIITEDNQLVKYDANGKKLFDYNNNTLGELVHIDVTDPFNILLYYPDFTTIITLSRTLNLTGEYNLLDLDVVTVRVVGMSNDNNIWLYDDIASKLKKIDRQGKLLEESGDLSMQVTRLIQANFILERENWVYLNDPEIGIFVFDLYGRFTKIIDIKGLDSFQVIDNQLFFSQEGKLFVFHLQSLLTTEITLPQAAKKKELIRLQKNMLYFKEADHIHAYSF